MRRAQSYLDYAALIALIAMSLTAMSGYVFRAIRARISHVKQDLSDPITGVR